ncbi:UNVERIFIED_ORG: hypothetical protein LHK14_01695 [Roseateles sp. XES5]|nr:hypothetical protein [Roseateles sp. XES5]
MGRWARMGGMAAAAGRVSNDRAAALIRFVEANPVFHALKILGGTVGFIVVLATAIQIWIDIDDRRDERAERREDAIERAWNRLLRPAVGNTGKGQAISLLVREGVPLDGVDLSCAAIGRWAEGACVQPVVFAGMEMHSDRHAPMTFERNVPNLATGVDFSHAIIQGASIRNFTLTGTFTAAVIRDARFIRSRLQLDLAGAEIRRSAFALSSVHLDGTPPALYGVDVSGALAPWIFDLDKDALQRLVAWADMPPAAAQETSLQKREEVLEAIMLCDPEWTEGGSRSAYEDRTSLVDRYHPLLGWRCGDMTLAAARTAYPAAYRAVLAPSP